MTSNRHPSRLAGCALVAALLQLVAPSAHAGMVAFFDIVEGKCPRGWSEAVYAKGRLIKGTTKGGVGQVAGEPLADKTPPSHTHAYKVSAELASREVVAVEEFWPFDQNTGVAKSGEATTASGTSSSSNGDIPLMQFLTCEEDAETNTAQHMRGEMVAFFNAASCPAGWEPYHKLNNRFVVPLPSDAETGDHNVAVDMPAGTGRVHAHGLSVASSADDVTADIKLPLQTIGMEASSTGVFVKERTGWAVPEKPTTSGAVSATTTKWPYVVLRACRKKEGRGSVAKLPGDMLAFMTAQSCPNGWREKASTRGRFLVGLPAGRHAKSGAAFGGNPLNSREVRTHSHHLKADMSFASRPFVGFTGNANKGFTKAGKYTIEGDTQRSASELPYVQMLHCITPPAKGSSSSGIRQ